MNLRDLVKHASAVRKVLKSAPGDLRHFGDAAHGAADLIETGQQLAAQLAANPLASAMGIAQAFGGKPTTPPRAPAQRAPSTASFRPPPAPKRQAPIKVAPAVVEVIDATFEETVIDPSKPAPKRR